MKDREWRSRLENGGLGSGIGSSGIEALELKAYGDGM